MTGAIDFSNEQNDMLAEPDILRALELSKRLNSPAAHAIVEAYLTELLANQPAIAAAR